MTHVADFPSETLLKQGASSDRETDCQLTQIGKTLENLVSGKRINSYQRKFYMRAREIGLNQAKAAYIAEIPERTGQRIESGEHQPNRGKVTPGNAQDPLEGLWEKELEPIFGESRCKERVF